MCRIIINWTRVEAVKQLWPLPARLIIALLNNLRWYNCTLGLTDALLLFVMAAASLSRTYLNLVTVRLNQQDKRRPVPLKNFIPTLKFILDRRKTRRQCTEFANFTVVQLCAFPGIGWHFYALLMAKQHSALFWVESVFLSKIRYSTSVWPALKVLFSEKTGFDLRYLPC